MKKFSMFLIGAAFLICGCDEPNLALIDDCNPDIKVIEYTEGLFVATIKYDYSKIENYNPDNIRVVTVLSDFHKLNYKRPADEILAELGKFRPDLLNERKYKLREDEYKVKEPGLVKVICADTVGKYILVYVP